ncbi:MAG TPA: tRNA uridine-5-carboxymethylaminomethyl(34) synthesis GTPase MnmE [Acidobacteriota bacterium]|nr:tRNA uridine-5-carboxymethylaminomethyl(34) synthesis GTPase MnmE [Acidobacteriota bacterium]
MSADLNDTIIALATVPGRSALALLRISGPQSLEFLTRLCEARQWRERPRQARLTRLNDLQGGEIDRGLVTFFSAPHSYTGQDVVEISLHGSSWVCRKVLECALQSGLRLAGPGEFTQRAFLLGKMDLIQAEAVRDLIESETAFQARVARSQMEGALSRRLQPLKDELVKVISHMETALEFVEDQVEPEGREALTQRLLEAADFLAELEESFQVGRLLHEGITIALVGRPNVGKSSLFNALMSDERAIVTEIPGTTRDALRERVDLHGIPAQIVDTAGIRETREEVEKLGVERTLQMVAEADVSVFVVDGAEPFSDEDSRSWQAVEGRRPLLVVNKRDKGVSIELPERVEQGCIGRLEVSAASGEGVDRLRQELWRLAGGEEVAAGGEAALLTNVRQQGCVRECREALLEGLQGYRSGLSEEFALYDLRRALEALGRLTGEVTVEEILGEIFSTFCIGK